RRLSLLLVELGPRSGDDVGGGYRGRAGGDAVVAGQAGAQRTVGDVGELEASLDGVADQRDPSPGGLPLHRVDHVGGADRLAERALVATGGGLVDVGQEGRRLRGGGEFGAGRQLGNVVHGRGIVATRHCGS